MRWLARFKASSVRENPHQTGRRANLVPAAIASLEVGSIGRHTASAAVTPRATGAPVCSRSRFVGSPPRARRWRRSVSRPRGESRRFALNCLRGHAGCPVRPTPPLRAPFFHLAPSSGPSMYDIHALSHPHCNFVDQSPRHLLSRLARGLHVLFVEEPVFAEAPLVAGQRWAGRWRHRDAAQHGNRSPQIPESACSPHCCWHF